MPAFDGENFARGCRNCSPPHGPVQILNLRENPFTPPFNKNKQTIVQQYIRSDFTESMSFKTANQ